MTIAISAQGNGWEQALDERFGRAQGFFLVNSVNETFRYIENAENVDASHGAGTGTVQMLIENHIDAVITGRVGPKAASALEAAGIRVVLAEEGVTVRGAWEHYRNNDSLQTQ